MSNKIIVTVNAPQPPLDKLRTLEDWAEWNEQTKQAMLAECKEKFAAFLEGTFEQVHRDLTQQEQH